MFLFEEFHVGNLGQLSQDRIEGEWPTGFDLLRLVLSKYSPSKCDETNTVLGMLSGFSITDHIYGFLLSLETCR